MPESLRTVSPAPLPTDPTDATAVPESDARLSRRPAFDPVAQPFVIANQGLDPVAPDVLLPERLRARFAQPPVWTPEVSNEEWFRRAGGEEHFTPAAVLIALVQHDHGTTVLLTRRTAHLREHAGQISFPGGRTEPTDASPSATALRETEEEVGLTADDIEVVGTLPDFHTGTGFRVVPVVALVAPGFTLRPDPFEVDEVFEVPADFLMNPAHHQAHVVELPDGRRRHYYSMPWADYFIWGATAGMLRNLYHFLRA